MMETGLLTFLIHIAHVLFKERKYCIFICKSDPKTCGQNKKSFSAVIFPHIFTIFPQMKDIIG